VGRVVSHYFHAKNLVHCTADALTGRLLCLHCAIFPCGCSFTCYSLIWLPGYGSTGPAYVSGLVYGSPPPHHISTGYGAPTAPSGLYGAPFKLTARGSSAKTASPTAKSSSSREYNITSLLYAVGSQEGSIHKLLFTHLRATNWALIYG
jgi:hypothetical protein